MEQSMTVMPELLLNLRRDEGTEPYILSCSIVGQTTGVSGVVRRFTSTQDLAEDLRKASIAEDRYEEALSGIEQDPGKTISFRINLNEAQNLSVIQTDSIE
jgi:hypothetical protein